MRVDLRTRYLKLELKNPLVASASPLCGRIDLLRRMEDAGAAAVVMPSLFEEQIRLDPTTRKEHRFYELGAERSPNERDFFAPLHDHCTDLEHYLRHIERAKASLSIPVIGSLNGTSEGSWTRYARLIERAGADALELNIYDVVADPNLTGEQVESRILKLVESVRDSTSIPLSVKLSPYFSSLANMARRLIAAGADGLVLFNRFMQPDVDLESLQVVPNLILSTSDELRLPLRWIAILHPLVNASMAATTGVHTAEDVLKLLLVGADVTMLASILYQHGVEYFRTLLDGIGSWMEAKGYGSVDQLRGRLSREKCGDPSAFERAHYIQQLVSFTGPEA